MIASNAAIADQEEHGPNDSARNPDEPSATSAAPMRRNLGGPGSGRLAEGQCLIVGC